MKMPITEMQITKRLKIDSFFGKLFLILKINIVIINKYLI